MRSNENKFPELLENNSGKKAEGKNRTTELTEKEKKEIQSQIIKEWAKSQNPPLEEGKDFMLIFSFADAVREGESIAPHELGNLYLGFKKENFHKFTDFFVKEYPKKMEEREMREPWSSGVKLNYSWGGRYLIHGEGGVAIDSAPVETIDPNLCKPEHSKFKDFFKEKYGFELPTADKLNEIVVEMSNHLDWYQQTLQELKTKQSESKDPWEYDSPIMQLEYAVIILRDAKILKIAKEDLETAERLDSKEAISKSQGLVDRYTIKELPDEFSYFGDKTRHYNDLTYNADDLADLEKVKTLLGSKIDLPKKKGARIDRIYEDYYDFDRKNFETACHEFSEKLFPRKADVSEKGRSS